MYPVNHLKNGVKLQTLSSRRSSAKDTKSGAMKQETKSKHILLQIVDKVGALALLLFTACRVSMQQRDPAEPEMVFVEGGTFTMGCASEQGEDCFDDEKPAHQVTLSNYYIGKYEVTQAQWKAVMGNNPSYFSGCDNCPVEQVSWDDVQEFIRKLNAKTGKNYRLPTEAEWEYAARGGNRSQGYKYSGSNSVGNVAWYDDNSGYKTHPVGTKQANELGIYDMNGNVWEWCQDWYDNYNSGSQTNPNGASSGSYRVSRGGSWFGNARYVRVSDRGNGTPGFRFNFLGFRLACSSK
jgi:formylglycine-generating enzyme required for sulfatase activity